MKKAFSFKMGEHDAEYILEENESGITVSVPFIDHDEENNEIINHNYFYFDKGKKADFICQFFIEKCVSIVRGEIAYSIDDVIHDDFSLPENINPDF